MKGGKNSIPACLYAGVSSDRQHVDQSVSACQG